MAQGSGGRYSQSPDGDMMNGGQHQDSYPEGMSGDLNQQREAAAQKFQNVYGYDNKPYGHQDDGMPNPSNIN